MKQVLGSDVPVEDAGFRHGHGVFETVRVKDGMALFAEWHWESLCEAADALGLEVPIGLPLDLPPGRNGLWRWFHTETGIRATWDDALPEIPSSFSLRVSGICHPSQAWTSRYKTLSYLGNLQARQIAGGDEALLLNEHGKVATGAMSNVFWVRNRVIFTPSVECGCRKGIVRRWILEQAGISFQEVAVSWDELLLAEEVFMTNSRIGILPVHDFEGHALLTGKTTRFLQESYSACLSRMEE